MADKAYFRVIIIGAKAIAYLGTRCEFVVLWRSRLLPKAQLKSITPAKRKHSNMCRFLLPSSTPARCSKSNSTKKNIQFAHVETMAHKLLFERTSHNADADNGERKRYRKNASELTSVTKLLYNLTIRLSCLRMPLLILRDPQTTLKRCPEAWLLVLAMAGSVVCIRRILCWSTHASQLDSV